MIDGELVAEDANGLSHFSLLQQDLKEARHDRMALYAFDLMHLDGTTSAAAAERRKAALAKLLARAAGRYA